MITSNENLKTKQAAATFEFEDEGIFFFLAEKKRLKCT